MAVDLEQAVRSMYPFLLDSETFLTNDAWVLDSGCGFGLTSEESRFVEKRPDNGYMFTFAEGSKHTNTHIGTVKLYLHGPGGIRPFQFTNIALVPHAILSEYWLQRGGYQIIGSANGDFKFVLYKNQLVFVAKAINGAYYIQSKTVKERQAFCHAVKTQPCKPLALPGVGKVEAALKEWHAKLGHLNKEQVITMLTKPVVAGMPTLKASDLRQVPFFCTTSRYTWTQMVR
ncbi:uncharacterized protein PITG_12095 [Phytophthora infestans T30-4]|uniref:Uncharacterized protein n=1 Tax=Phytophthora infestans (strain T30-4) TaxID=403677 RepID=D0NJ11_PHYIT|nr:uncharacterized protein PITG_12095 [Phytophthora infestans T30-4]EEY59529.1 hypothetical protein PITG_12095 [Phytophthora infestans T30-4]|eukprot:XP_002900722.1 hypothetical protein PITG_12095 [Phytophthora infestans T30-4]